jgi:hypothetical protein
MLEEIDALQKEIDARIAKENAMKAKLAKISSESTSAEIRAKASFNL